MQEQIDKNIERLTDKMLEEMPKVSPSIDFTNTVMSQVETLESKKVTAYKPLIPKNLWFVIRSDCRCISRTPLDENLRKRSL